MCVVVPVFAVPDGMRRVGGPFLVDITASGVRWLAPLAPLLAPCFGRYDCVWGPPRGPKVRFWLPFWHRFLVDTTASGVGQGGQKLMRRQLRYGMRGAWLDSLSSKNSKIFRKLSRHAPTPRVAADLIAQRAVRQACERGERRTLEGNGGDWHLMMVPTKVFSVLHFPPVS